MDKHSLHTEMCPIQIDTTTAQARRKSKPRDLTGMLHE